MQRKVETANTWLNCARSNVNMGKDIFLQAVDCAAAATLIAAQPQWYGDIKFSEFSLGSQGIK